MSARPCLSVVVCFHDMQREIQRTLHTLSYAYQRGTAGFDYEVIAVDNGSAVPLRSEDVEKHGANMRLFSVDGPRPSPCAAINDAVRAARADNIMVCIDGARMHSPGTIRYAMQALSLDPHPFAYALGMHLGPKPQNESLVEGYGQAAEDALLESIDWRRDGYLLFDVSSVAYSSRNGFLSRLSESNCFAMRKDDYLSLGGLDERFEGPGGGLVNLDFFNSVHEQEWIRPYMLLGEATFHQFHGGVATNVERKDHPWEQMADEYSRIRGKKFSSVWRAPDYIGWLSARYHRRLVSFD